VRLPVLALALGAFAIGTTEFVTMGLLPEMAATFDVSIPSAGWRVTSYALGVVVGAPLLTAAAHRFPRRQVLVWLMVIFTVGHVVAVLAPTFAVLVASRVVTALTHGASFGASAVIGVPLGTAVGQQLGWRLTYAIVGAFGGLTIAAIVRFVPHVPRGGGNLRGELRAFGRGQVWLTLLVTVLGFGGMFAVLSYITPILTEVSGYPVSRVPWLLVLFGLGATFGNLLGGRLALGAFLGGGVISWGLGYRAPILVATLLALTGLVVMVVAERLDRNGRLPVEAAHAASEPAPLESVAA
jgi:MFS transporter, DHA1 family, inner membrane transport protein